MRRTAPLLLPLLGILLATSAASASHAADARRGLSAELRALLALQPDGLEGFTMPRRGDLAAIPQHEDNVLTAEKIRLGRRLYHETAVGTESPDAARRGQYGCASCHFAQAGFKSGLPQGLSDGGSGFGPRGRDRVLLDGMDANLPDGHANRPDLQPVASPSTLNAAWQSVTLWSGELGSSADGPNAGRSLGGGPPGLLVNDFGLPGLETQAIAGTKVHRLRFDEGSILQTNRHYRRLYAAAYPDGDTGYIPPGSGVSVEALGAAKAIAAYERTLMSRRAPFQRWLRRGGRGRAMTARELRGALVFFDADRGNCVACHTGPALGSRGGAREDEIFHAVGFADFDTTDPRIHGTVPDKVRRGRGGFTGVAADDHRFKVPQLYNLTDAPALGHGASFTSIRQVVDYKNRAVPAVASDNLAPEFRPLGLRRGEIRDLVAFLKRGLHDPALERYAPRRLPSRNCFPVADFDAVVGGGADCGRAPAARRGTAR